MKKRRALFLTLPIILLLIISFPTGFFVREYRQERMERQLIQAVKRQDASAVLSLLAHGADANAQDKPPDPRPVWRILLDRLQGKRSPPSQAPTALLVALASEPEPSAGSVHVETAPLIRALLDRGANLHILAENGDTPLIMAARMGSVGTVGQLLDHGANVNATNGGHTALMEAIRWGSEGDQDHAAVCTLLLQRGANPNIRREGDGFTPLMCALYGQHEHAARLLLQWKADVNVGWQEHAKTALDCAYYHLPSFVPILKQAGAKE